MNLKIDSIEEHRKQLLEHPMYKLIDNTEKVKVFMQHHVFAVWDFMTLLKRLQQDVTNVTIPWTPAKEANYARFINEIVLGEETDEDGDGGYISHFELYLLAMQEVGASPSAIEEYIQKIKAGENPFAALEAENIPPSVAKFVNYDLKLATEGKPHEVAAAFFFGREDLIPDMFQVVLDELQQKKIQPKWLTYYLKRHIELDGDEHGPLAEKLLQSLCGNDPVKWKEAEQTAYRSIDERIQLWNGVIDYLK